MELLRDLNERDGTAMVAVLHDLGLAAHFFPRLVVIDRGRLVADGPPSEVLTDDLIRDVFGVEPALVRLAARPRPDAGTLRPCARPVSSCHRVVGRPRRLRGPRPPRAAGAAASTASRRRGLAGSRVGRGEHGPAERGAGRHHRASRPRDRDADDGTGPSASDAGTAAACTGSDDNRTFFAVAAQVDWTVVCAVLPKRWFVSAGSFRLAKGGKLLISYKGPNGATLSLSEGAWCTDAAGCVPSGQDLGEAALGPMPGSLFGVAGGGFAVAVGRRGRSWLLETQGLDQATSEELAAAAVAVGS